MYFNWNNIRHFKCQPECRATSTFPIYALYHIISVLMCWPKGHSSV